MRHHRAVALLVTSMLCGCTPPRPNLTPEAVAQGFAGVLRGVYFNPGALVQAQMHDGRVVTGRVITRLTPDSSTLVICDVADSLCTSADSPGVLRLGPREVNRLAVRGKATGIGGYGGLYLGGLIGALAGSDESGGTMGLGFITGLLVGSAIGSRVTGWIPVYPCVHGCAAGEYPDSKR